MKTVFVIKHLKKGIWVYFTSWEDRKWDADLYCAKEFETYVEAEAFLKGKCDTEHWGGFFQIEKHFVSR